MSSENKAACKWEHAHYYTSMQCAMQIDAIIEKAQERERSENDKTRREKEDKAKEEV